jgi:hypothetical protein
VSDKFNATLEDEILVAKILSDMKAKQFKLPCKTVNELSKSELRRANTLLYKLWRAGWRKVNSEND